MKKSAQISKYAYFALHGCWTLIEAVTFCPRQEVLAFPYLPRNGSVFVHNAYNTRLFTPWMPGEGTVLQKAQRSGDISMPRVRIGCRIRLVQRGNRDHPQARKGLSEDRHRHSATWRMLWTSGTEVINNVGLLFLEYRPRRSFKHIVSSIVDWAHGTHNAHFFTVVDSISLFADKR